MNKKIIFAMMALSIAMPASFVFGQENSQEASKQALETQRESAKKALETQRESAKKNIQTQRETNKQNMLTQVQAGADKQALEAQREANKQALEAQREANKQAFENQREANKLEFQASKEKMLEEKCKGIEARISERIGKYENNKKTLELAFANMQARLTRLLAKLKTAGADTTQLESDIATLNGKIEKLRADQASFMAILQESQTFVCGKSEGEFKNKIETARQIPAVIQQDRQDIKAFFENTIKADLQAIRTALAAQKAATPATTTATTPAATVAQ